MSKETIKARILNEITSALSKDSITPAIVGGILDEILEIGVSPYRVYTALLTQSGTSAPVPTILEDTIGGGLVWQYTDVGFYTLGFAELGVFFTLGKTGVVVNNGQNQDTAPYILEASRSNNGNVVLIVKNPSNGILTNSGLHQATIEVRLYN